MKYLTLAQVIEDERFPFTMGQIRSFLMNRENNGFDKVVRKIGKRIYFRDDLLLKWIDNQKM